MPQHAVKKQNLARPRQRLANTNSNSSSNGSAGSGQHTHKKHGATTTEASAIDQLGIHPPAVEAHMNLCSCHKHYANADVPFVAKQQVKSNGDVVHAEQVPEAETMQLSFKDPSHQEFVLPTYPVADTLALVLILINFPNVLVMVTHLMFSYKEHVSAASSSLASPPLFMILFVDAIVVLFTAVILPSLRSTITDISHVIIAISMSGAKWRYTFPFAAALTSMRVALNKLANLGRLQDWNMEESSWLQSAWHRFGSQLLRPLRGLVANPPELSSSYTLSDTVMGSVKSAVAIHVFSLGLIRLVKYWIQSSHASSVPPSKRDESGSKKKRHQQQQQQAITAELKMDARQPSIWDQFLNWRIDTMNKRQGDPPLNVGPPSAWVAEITPWYVSLCVSTGSTESPQLTMQVNGLPWDAKPIASSDNTETTWSLFVENLSPKTEYDIALEFTEPNLGRYHFAICTSSRDAHQPRRLRGDSSLPAINTNLQNATIAATVTTGQGNTPEEPVLSTDNTAHPNGPLSPITTLEDSIAIAAAKLEEKRAALKRTRKENTKRLQLLQREVDHLAQRTTGTDKTEMRMQGRMLSLQNEVKRIQESIDEMEAERQQLVSEHEQQARRWQSEHDKAMHEAALLQAAKHAFEETKAAHERRFATAEQDAAKTRAKADKLSLRRTKIQQDLDRLATEHEDLLLKEYQDRRMEREQVRDMRLQAEADLLKSLHEMQQQADLLQTYTGTVPAGVLN
ncbi:hypothetical protein BCR37DRAFT_91951 [Protomyces lactucae-debilis]|uniref:Ubiquitination network signaling protein acrB n=1 Tax=Protomyces lactucae-debilis TaxID=2754530 RepID=A0A1Y2F6E5_PROLT|nr:uncharacterized protein BCR37DRAFT_91951 [Protomyces lactucae-debilis]ORY79453.1 hypothetical protein BCR37DRAFT_91951 [Protomyces lactucae-debilis]